MRRGLGIIILAARPEHAEPLASGQMNLSNQHVAQAVWSEATTKKDLPAGPWQEGRNHLNGGN
jgi:hypothetical protein